MVIDALKNGIVVDHIKAGLGMEIYGLLGLGELDTQVAIIKNAQSHKMGRKDIIKIDGMCDIDLTVLGYIDPNCTVSIIRDGVRIEKFHPELPERLEGILKCKNPRCITSVEQELKHIFKLTDRESRTYRCLYCESKYKGET